MELKDIDLYDPFTVPDSISWDEWVVEYQTYLLMLDHPKFRQSDAESCVYWLYRASNGLNTEETREEAIACVESEYGSIYGQSGKFYFSEEERPALRPLYLRTFQCYELEG